MRVTADMTRDPSDPDSGHLLDLADYEDQDGTGIKVTLELDRVRIKTDSYSPFGSSVWLRPEDAVGLAARICVQANLLEAQLAILGVAEPAVAYRPRHAEPEPTPAERRAASDALTGLRAKL